MPSIAAQQIDYPQDQFTQRKPPASESGSSPYGVTPPSRPPIDFAALKQDQERLLNAREVAARLGVSERWVRDHTTRRSPKLRGVKLGTLMRYRRADVDEFMERLTTSRTSLQPRFGG